MTTQRLWGVCSGSEKWFIFGVFLLSLNYFTSFSIQKDLKKKKKVKIKYKPNLLISGGEANTEIKRNWFFFLDYHDVHKSLAGKIAGTVNIPAPAAGGFFLGGGRKSGISTFLEILQRTCLFTRK